MSVLTELGRANGLVPPFGWAPKPKTVIDASIDGSAHHRNADVMFHPKILWRTLASPRGAQDARAGWAVSRAAPDNPEKATVESS